MSEQSKPREFWIIKYPEQLKIDMKVQTFKPVGISVQGNPNEYLHVIEFSAYQALQEKLRLATEALKSAVECDEEFWGKRGRREAELALAKIEGLG